MKNSIEKDNILIFEHGSINTKRMIGEELEELITFKPTFINTFTREIKNQYRSLIHNSSNKPLSESGDIETGKY